MHCSMCPQSESDLHLKNIFSTGIIRPQPEISTKHLHASENRGTLNISPQEDRRTVLPGNRTSIRPPVCLHFKSPEKSRSPVLQISCCSTFLKSSCANSFSCEFSFYQQQQQVLNHTARSNVAVKKENNKNPGVLITGQACKSSSS